MLWELQRIAAIRPILMNEGGPEAPLDRSLSTTSRYGTSLAIVRRQGFWNQCGPKLIESLAHLFGLVMRRAGGDASVAFRVSSVCTILPDVLGTARQHDQWRSKCWRLDLGKKIRGPRVERCF